MRRGTVFAVAAVVAVGVLALALVSSPGADDEVPVSSLAEVVGRWEAVDATKAPAELVAPVSILFADVGLFVETGCNTGRGGAHVDEGRLVLEALATTRRACPPPLDAQERWVLVMLDAGPSLTRSGDLLILRWGPDDEYRLTFRSVEPDGSSSTPAPSV